MMRFPAEVVVADSIVHVPGLKNPENDAPSHPTSPLVDVKTFAGVPVVVYTSVHGVDTVGKLSMTKIRVEEVVEKAYTYTHTFIELPSVTGSNVLIPVCVV
jgi:hypothetical protein